MSTPTYDGTITLQKSEATPTLTIVLSMEDSGGSAINPSTAYDSYEATVERAGTTAPIATQTGSTTASTVTFTFDASDMTAILLRSGGSLQLTIAADASDGTLGPRAFYRLAFESGASEAGAATQEPNITWTVVSDSVTNTVYTGPTGASGGGSGDMTKVVYDPNDDGVIAVAQGGTGATSASGARTALGAAASSHTHTLSDITDAGTAAASNTGDFATAAQGTLADSSVQPGDDADTLGSGAATDGQILTADGAGNAAWEDAPAGGGSGTVDTSGTPVALDIARFTDADTIEGVSYSELRTAINVEDGATADQTGAEIKAAYEAEADTNAYTDAEKTKLGGIEASADVTDAANVEAAGAVMDTGDETIAGVKTFSSSPIVPAPTTDLQAATKKYVDDNAGGGGAGQVAVYMSQVTTAFDHAGVPGVTFQSVATGSPLDTLSRPRYFPFLCSGPTDITAAILNVTSAGAAGAEVEFTFYEADEGWQPGTRLLAVQTVSVDTTGLKTVSLSLSLSAGRYLIGARSTTSSTAQYRIVRGGAGLIGGLRSSLAASLFVKALNVNSSASLTDPGTSWNDSDLTSVPGIEYPIVLQYEVTP